MSMRPQALALVPIALVGFGGGYLIGKPADKKATTSTVAPAPASFQLSKSQPSIAALGATTRYPPLVRVHTAAPAVRTGNGGGTTQRPPVTTQPPPPPITTTSATPPPPPPVTTNNAVTTN